MPSSSAKISSLKREVTCCTPSREALRPSKFAICSRRGHFVTSPRLLPASARRDLNRLIHVRRVDLRGRRDELGTWRVEGGMMYYYEGSHGSKKRKGPNHDHTNWEVDLTNSIHDETNRNNDSTSWKTNIVSNLTSYVVLYMNKKLFES